jgi:hypothetical protein
VFTQTYIVRVYPPVIYGNEMQIRWTHTAPAGTVFQVYVNGHLQAFGEFATARVPVLPGVMQIDIGSVGPGEGATDFSSFLILPDNRVTLTWTGGTFLSPNIAGFHVYMSDASMGTVDYSKLIATVPAYAGGIITDGFGNGTYGGGSYGYASASYTWTSGTVNTGTWSFGIKPVDVYGNEGATMEHTVAIGVPPIEMPAFPDNTRLHYSLLRYGQPGYNLGGFGNPEITLNWLPTVG